MTETVGGDFWVPDSPGLRVRGELTVEDGKKPEASLAEPLVDDGRVIQTDSAAESVQAFLPITLQGDLDTGKSVTLNHAQNYGGRFGLPRYVGYDVVLGDTHVTGEDQHYGAVRFRMDHPYWLDHLLAGESSVVDDDGSTRSKSLKVAIGWRIRHRLRRRCGSLRFG